MKKIVYVLTGILIISMASTAFAGRWSGSGGWGMGGAYQRMFNPATLKTVSGEVAAVDRMTPKRGMGAGIHLKLKTDKETISVHLGPAWYIERLDERIAKGDRLEVKGSRVLIAGETAIIASEVKKGEAILKLRDESGMPAWAGWRR